MFEVVKPELLQNFKWPSNMSQNELLMYFIDLGGEVPRVDPPSEAVLGQRHTDK